MQVKKHTSAEYYQLWAELCRIDSVTFSAAVVSPDEYYNGNVNYPQINYWDWFIIPGEIIFHRSSQIEIKPRVKNTPKVNHKPLLFCRRTIVPLRI